HCYYHGQVEGLEHSMVALSTCSGLRGIILIGEQSYAIEPVAESPANEHLLFLLEHSQHEPFACGVSTEMPPPLEEDPETPRQAETRHSDTVGSMTRLFRKKRNLPQTRYVELILVADKSRYVYKNSNETAVNEELIQMANLLDGYYQQLNIRVILVGVVIWKTQDPINVDGQAGQVLDSFVKWRKTYLVPRKRNDMAMLLVGRNTSYNGGILGMAVVGTVCSPSSAGGISVFIANSLQYYSTVVAHEMGHNLGMNHDDKICDCNGSCIMHALAGGSTKFSTCSSNDFINLILQGGGICLNNQPLPSDVFSEPSCGNGLVEQGEQCDCGKPQDCTNKCCDAATCKFSKGSACAQGLCCENCQMNVAGTPCRESVNPCDLPEFCLGNSPSCPIDYYIMDGFPCANNTAYCFEGRCQTYDYQCQQLFGNDAEKAVDACFVDSNTRGDRFGNCGRNGATYIQCTLANVKCGKIQCSNVDITKLPYGATITLHYVGQNQCFNADFDLGSDVVDPAYVNPGSSCDQGKTCFNYQCSNTSALNYTCDTQTQCNGRGVCDNLGHCYCNNGWAPPNCDRSGSGGSIDSGPTKIDTSLRDGLLIFFLLVVPVLILIGAILFFVFKRGGLQRCRRRKRSSQNQ
ncbi:ADAM9 protein, partial [Amia calva]|nr:ADAM9 protein [Amia calva]